MSRMNVALSADEKSWASRFTTTQSLYFVTAQNPAPDPSGPPCQETGACSLRAANQWWGTPATKLAESVRSISLRSTGFLLGRASARPGVTCGVSGPVRSRALRSAALTQSEHKLRTCSTHDRRARGAGSAQGQAGTGCLEIEPVTILRPFNCGSVPLRAHAQLSPRDLRLPTRWRKN